MSGENDIPNVRLGSLTWGWAGLCSGILMVSSVLPVLAQAGRPRRSAPAPRPAFSQRQPVRSAQNTVPQKPANRATPPAQVHPQPLRSQAGQPQTTAPASVPVRPTPQVSASPGQLVTPNRPGQTQQHLADWMEGHRNLPLAEQQHALENEPGFRSLPQPEQQQLHQRLTQLNNMAPEQRQKLLERTEAMERLAPVQRQQVRAAMAQLGSIPEERRHIVSRQFYLLRDMPAAQRQAYMNSPQYQNQFNEQERGAIGGLLNVTPIYPPLQAQSR